LAAGSYDLRRPDNTTICEDNAAGDGSGIFDTPVAVPLSFDRWLGTPSLFTAEPASPIAIIELGTGCVASIDAIVNTYVDELLGEAGLDAALNTTVHPPETLRVNTYAPGAPVSVEVDHARPPDPIAPVIFPEPVRHAAEHPATSAPTSAALAPIVEDDEHCALIDAALDEYLQHTVQGAFLRSCTHLQVRRCRRLYPSFRPAGNSIS
jgi:hypothetical protein